MEEDLTKTKAWVGDAVLALWAREWILRQPNIAVADRAAVFKSMTSNQFLSALGRPTQVEADIGEVYERDGLQATFAYLDERLMPVFQRQRRNAAKPGNWKKRV